MVAFIIYICVKKTNHVHVLKLFYLNPTEFVCNVHGATDIMPYSSQPCVSVVTGVIAASPNNS